MLSEGIFYVFAILIKVISGDDGNYDGCNETMPLSFGMPTLGRTMCSGQF